MRFLYITLICTISIFLRSQSKGIVFDEFQHGIQGATIQVFNKGTHSHSDEFGRFELNNVNTGDSIRISVLGYSSRVIAIMDLNHFLEIKLSESPIFLNDVEVNSKINQNLQKIDLSLRPIQNSQELLKYVPGLFIAQHAGAGKAEQIFLRGFDIDHGTDISISVDDLIPVNMVSHAHGQGYSDLHFIIPESVQAIEFDKGSYDARKGNFATAGYVNFKLKEKINATQISMEAGSFDFYRFSSLIPIFNLNKSNAYIGGEYLSSQGYFDSPQGLKKVNLLAKFNYQFNSSSGIKFTSTFFRSHWTASGQIPTRAVNDRTISRFGAIDPTEGGKTSRVNIKSEYYYSRNIHELYKIKAYYSSYDFELYSNFTFFLNDTINGDQIKQKENRNIYGIESTYDRDLRIGKLSVGIGSRYDNIPNSVLLNTKNKTVLLNTISNGRINEINSYSYLGYLLNYKKFDLDIQARLDRFDMMFDNLIISEVKNYSEYRFSPKFNLQYLLNEKISTYLKTGLGYHSNDTRIIALENNANVTTLSKNADVGLQYKWSDNSILHSGLWYIGLEDELVYVGDEGIVESSGQTKRLGWELGLRSQFFKYFTLDIDASYTLANSVDDPEGENYIPLAVKWCSEGGLQFNNNKKFSAGLRYRFIGDRPANEDYSIVAPGYFILDATAGYQVKNIRFGLNLENILNTEWNEAQFATLSRLKNELNPVEEINFTPGTPFNLRFKVEIKL